MNAFLFALKMPVDDKISQWEEVARPTSGAADLEAACSGETLIHGVKSHVAVHSVNKRIGVFGREQPGNSDSLSPFSSGLQPDPEIALRCVNRSQP